MIVSRLVAIFLRFGEFVCGAVVLGLMAWFLRKYDHMHQGGPLAREIYTIVLAALSTITSLVWLLPTTRNMLHYPFDLFMCVAWFAAFAALVNWIQSIDCGYYFNWSDISVQHRTDCGQWKAAEAFSFISACFWFVSFLLGIWVYHKLSRPNAAAPAPAGGAPVTTRRRWWRRSRV